MQKYRQLTGREVKQSCKFNKISAHFFHYKFSLLSIHPPPNLFLNHSSQCLLSLLRAPWYQHCSPEPSKSRENNPMWQHTDKTDWPVRALGLPTDFCIKLQETFQREKKKKKKPQKAKTIKSLITHSKSKAELSSKRCMMLYRQMAL